MQPIYFPAKLRRFVTAVAFEADVDLFFGVYTRKTIVILPDREVKLSRDLDPKTLTIKYEGRTVYLRVEHNGMRESTLTLSVLLDSQGQYIPFVPNLQKFVVPE